MGFVSRADLDRAGPARAARVDIHAHVLPGLDDGPPDIAEAVAMCAAAEKDGTGHIVGVCHLFHAGAQNVRTRTDSALRALVTAARAQGLTLGMSCATETPLMEDLLGRLDRGDLATVDPQGRYLLLEPPRSGDFQTLLMDMIFKLRLRDMTPIVVHPECSDTFRDRPDRTRQIVDQGAVFQVTAQNLMSALATSTPRLVLDMLAQGHIHMLASDAHDLQRRPPKLSDAYDLCALRFGQDMADLMLVHNPGRVLAGDDVLEPRPVAEAPSPERPPGALQRWLRELVGARSTCRENAAR